MKTCNGALLILLLFAIGYLLPLEFRALWQPDEVRYAEISREMLASGNWVVPHFLGLRYFEKPVAGYWINNLGQLLFGSGNFAVRFGSVFTTALTALLVFWLAQRLWQQTRLALLAVTVFLSCLLVYAVGNFAVLDPMVALWLTAAMCSFWLVAENGSVTQRLAGWLLLGLACGMGFMTKGFLALAVPVVAIVPWMLWQRRWRELLLHGPLALLSAALVAAPWALCIARQQPDFWRYFFWVEHVQRFAEGNAQHRAPGWYYLPVLVIGCLPWAGLLPGALWRAWRERGVQSGSAYLLSWILMPLLFFSAAEGKLPTYILPCFAPLALLLARHGTLLCRYDGRGLTVNAVLNVACGVTAACALLLLSSPVTAHHPVFSRGEAGKLLLGSLALLCWTLVGIVTLRQRQRWALAALCPFCLALVWGVVIPARVSDSKQPQAFIEVAAPRLAESRFIIANNTGLASALAWRLKRSDIVLLDQPGELSYGLDYPEGRGRLIDSADFPVWLAAHRRRGSVSLAVKFSGHGRSLDASFPPPDWQYRQGRLLFCFYRYQP